MIGWLIEQALIRHLYARPLDTLLATWGVSLILIQSVRLIFGADAKYVDVPEWLKAVTDIGFVHIPVLRIFIFFATILVALITGAVLFRTTVGIQVRAVMQNREVAAAFGINEKRIYGLTFAYGAGLAGISGAMFADLKTVFPDMGLGYVVEAFLVVVTGGGELVGSVVSAGLMGEISSIFSYFTNSTFARFLVFVLIVVFLRIRPQGVMGQQMARR